MLTAVPLGLGSNMNVCKFIESLRLGDILNSRRATSPLMRSVEREKRWEAPDHFQSFLHQNWERGNRTETYCQLYGTYSYS
ncbi:hypothetical protein TNCV_2070071 [Trichonephila clavipes]|uniref:Uncharacterized protein n=1 Tax=Trichonephila clavipes TaxID=2585209 RepID=A0A8X6W3J3_TRICX|nr:hypothetical protein TNCV_2070071 [Trichonephila clavipes]